MHHDCPICCEVTFYNIHNLNVMIPSTSCLNCWFEHTTICDCSICLNPQKVSSLCPVDIQSIRSAWRKWENICSECPRAPLVSLILTSPYLSENCPDPRIWFFIRYACPLCSKSVCDMSKVWEKFDLEIAATPMPAPYQKMVSIPFFLLMVMGIICYSM